MKNRIIVSSILTIVLCFSLIVGSTFALFTSEDEFDISITSGKVNIDATASIVGVYSAKGDAAGALVDENGATYVHEEQADNTFANGGTVAMDGANLVIDRLTPGDKVVLNVAIDNNSNVAIQYRYIIAVTDGELLATGMVVTVDGVAYEGLKSCKSAWITVDPNGAIADEEIAVELPIAAGNFYQDRSVQYTVLVEAVQGNGVVNGVAEVEQYDLVNEVTDGATALNGDFDGNHAVYSFANTDTTKANAGVTTTGGTLSNFSVIGEKMGNKGFRALYVTSLTEDLYLENVDLEGTYAMNVNASGITAYGIYAENSTFNGWTSYGSAKEVVFTNCSFGEAEGYANLRPYATTTLEGCDFAEGFTITRDAKDANTFTIALNNCTVDGVAVTADNFAALLGGDLLSSNSLATSANITVLVDGAAVNWNTDTVTFVSDLASLQDALNNTVEGDNIIYLTNDIAGDVVATQKANVNTVIEGAGHTFAGVLTVDGKSGTILTAGLTINNVKFSADSVSADACVRLGDGINTTRYVCNVTLDGCTFDVPDVVGVKSYTGGDKNISIVNCTATERAHSLAQLKGVDGVLVDNCTVNSVRGINLNNSNNVVINKSTFDVEKYAVRFGESANTIVENYTVTYCKLTSDCVDGDAVIVLRAGATNANLDLTGTTLNGSIEMTGYENANIVR